MEQQMKTIADALNEIMRQTLDDRDEIERLRKQSRQFWDAFQKAANEVIRLTRNAKQDAQFLMAYHHICQKHGIAPSSSDLIEAMQEIAEEKESK